MIRGNTNWRSDRVPFLMQPAGKDYLWGGNRLNDDFAKGMNLSPLAETWECSTHPEGPSRVSGGRFDGQTLPEVLKRHPDFLGNHSRDIGDLPILIKLIDAKQDLSVQVHPDDDFAKKYENGSLGKTEMWYVLDAAPGASIIYGFSNRVTKKALRETIAQGTVEKYLQKIPIRRDEVYYIEAGTVHAIGAGALIAEIQENSNLTYRLYDYRRRDKNGKERELHIEKALRAARLRPGGIPGQPMRVLKYREGCASELLCRCRYFEAERLLINTERCRKLVSFRTDEDSFQVLMCIRGCGMLFSDEGGNIMLFKGDCVFVPADSVPIRIHGNMQLLKIKC